jgi:hypothetical protein
MPSASVRAVEDSSSKHSVPYQLIHQKQCLLTQRLGLAAMVSAATLLGIDATPLLQAGTDATR